MLLHKEVKIVRLLEHITSDVGSIVDFAAGAETAFGTALLRSLSCSETVHCGHPKMAHISYMTQKKGYVLKSTTQMNLSGVIFAGIRLAFHGGGHMSTLRIFILP